MKKMLWKISRQWTIIIAVCFVFTACSGAHVEQEPEGIKMGRYMEEEVPFPGISSIETAEMIDGDRIRINGLKDIRPYSFEMDFSGSVTELNADWQKDLPDGSDVIFDSKIGPDGFRYIISMKEDIEQILYRQALEGGECVPVPLQFPQTGDVIRDFYLLENGEILISRFFGQAEQYDKDGNLKFVYTNKIWHSAYSNGQFAVYDSGNPEKMFFCVYDTETGNEIFRIDSIFSIMNTYGGELSFSDDGTLMYCSETGIYRITPEKIEQLVDGGLTSLINHNEYGIVKLFTPSDGAFYVLCENTAEQTCKLLKYEYHPDIPTVPQELLTIASYNNLPDNVQSVVDKMQKNYPQLQVKSRIYDETNSNVYLDVLKTINTEMLAGKGADLYLLDDLPWESYLEKGVFMDLTGLLSSGLDSDNIFSPILNAFSKDGKTCIVPTRFNLPTMFGSREFIEQVKTLPQLCEWAEQHPEPSLFFDNEWYLLYKLFLQTSYPELVTADGGINRENFLLFLECIERLTVLIAPDNAEYHTYPTYIHVEEGKSQIAMDRLDDVGNFNGARTIFEEVYGSFAFNRLPTLTPESPYYTFLPIACIGINANSEKPEIAKEFVLNLLSEEEQDKNFYDGFPIMRSSLKKEMEQERERVKSSSEFEEDAVRDSIMKRYDAMQKEIPEYFDRLNTPYIQDNGYTELLTDEVVEYFNNNRSLEDTVKAIEERVQMYLAE